MDTILIILSALILLVLLFIGIGILAPRQFSGSIRKEINASPEKVYEVLNDIESLPFRRKEIEKLEMLLPTVDGRKRWREIASKGGFSEFESLQEIPFKCIEVKMVRSSIGISGVWRYDIQPDADGTLVTISEKSRVDKLVTRSLLVLAGRNVTLRQEIKNLKSVAEA